MIFLSEAVVIEVVECEHLDGGVLEMDLDPVAVELDLVNPPLARRYLVD
jgi:hypothetical protein